MLPSSLGIIQMYHTLKENRFFNRKVSQLDFVSYFNTENIVSLSWYICLRRIMLYYIKCQMHNDSLDSAVTMNLIKYIYLLYCFIL